MCRPELYTSKCKNKKLKYFYVIAKLLEFVHLDEVLEIHQMSNIDFKIKSIYILCIMIYEDLISYDTI